MKNLLLAAIILLVSQMSFAVVNLPSAVCKVELQKFNFETRKWENPVEVKMEILSDKLATSATGEIDNFEILISEEIFGDPNKTGVFLEIKDVLSGVVARTNSEVVGDKIEVDMRRMRDNNSIIRGFCSMKKF
ncbi:MAG: hypothetical protein A2381_11130 [Bdellovibrionales bacterium RIFOXYB1_FULL_37_110]|nr:MAG: hypothetical protein A2181_01450 [Bdellovibrionales bacterium RIFOXYA1_FULL_38_20]OFZ48593.1 MAG: hypothetical protein A2417_09615 [Bdellovibrionales bacterium RIFOXYC1_FULL_37_79]OFZ58402.1 MAG: hypothetical protein A2381_11130 [Bdellovibrionales bacterium RIFOXYB1_FULL_37_110]